MNPFKFLIDDIKKDIQKVKDIRDKKAKLISWKELDFEGAFKTYWPWFLLLIAAFLAGFFIGSILSFNNCVDIIEDKCPQAFMNNDSVQQQTQMFMDYEQWQNTPMKDALDVKKSSKK